jgi:hypothetical protein
MLVMESHLVQVVKGLYEDATCRVSKLLPRHQFRFKFGNRTAVGITTVLGPVHLLFVTIRVELGRVPAHSQVNGNTYH